MPLCPRLYPGRTSTSLCDQWALVVVTGPLWQIDHDESQGWKPCSVTAGPGRARDDANREHCGQALAPALGPLSPSCASEALPASVILPANPIPDQRPREKKGEEERQRSEKGEGDWRVGGRGGNGEKKQVTLYLTGEAAARAGAPVCLLPPGLTPSSRPCTNQCQTHQKLPGQHPLPTVWNKQPFNLVWGG